jgi:hypothetical protein
VLRAKYVPSAASTTEYGQHFLSIEDGQSTPYVSRVRLADVIILSSTDSVNKSGQSRFRNVAK